jgi:hypothetical protein
VTDPRLSRHPVDVLIRQIIAGERRATDGDVEQIVERIATAPFNPDVMVVPKAMRGLVYVDDTLSSRAPSRLVHLVKRVLVERQWSSGTTSHDYLSDLRRGIRQDSARLALFARRGGSMVLSRSATDDVVPEMRRGSRQQPVVVVVYSADRGIIVSGYQASALDKVAIPGDVQWLK